MPPPLQCKVPWCPIQSFPASRKKQHQNDWHSTHPIVKKSKNLSFTPRRNEEGLLQCFCQRPSHARYSIPAMKALCYNHEDNDMEGLYLDAHLVDSVSKEDQSEEEDQGEDQKEWEVDMDIDVQGEVIEGEGSGSQELEGDDMVVDDEAEIGLREAGEEEVEEEVRKDEEETTNAGEEEDDVNNYTEQKMSHQETIRLVHCDTKLKSDVHPQFIYAYLLKLGIFYDRSLGIVVCPSENCKSPVRHDHIWSHCWNKGHWTLTSVPRPPSRSVLIAWLETVGLNKSPQLLLGRVVPLPHGVQAVEKAYKCTLPHCHATSRIFSSKFLFQAHHRNAENHPDGVTPLQNRSFEYVRAFALSLFRPERHYVEISNPKEVIQDLRIEEVVKATKLEDKKKRAVGMFKGLEDDRQAKDWVYFVKWHVELENNSIPALLELVAIPPEGLPESRLLPVVHHYLEQGNKDLAGLPQDIRSDLGDTGKSHDESIREMYEKGTTQHRARTLTACILMFLRLSKDPIPTFPSHLDPVHVEALARLGKVLEDSSSSDLDIESVFHATVLVLTKNTPKSQLLKVNKSLFLRFEVLQSIRQDGSFIRARDVAHNIAALRWGLRVVYAREFLKVLETLSREDGQYEFDVWMKDFHPYIAPTGERTFFTSMDSTQKAMTCYAAGEAETPNTLWDLDGQRVTVNTVTVNISRFREGLHSSISDVQDRINRLLPSHLVSKLHDRVYTLLTSHKNTLQMLPDHTHSIQPYVSLFNQGDGETEWMALAGEVQEAFAMDDRYFQIFEGKVTPIPNDIRTFFVHLDEIVAQLYFNIACSFGGAGRAPELYHLRYATGDQGDRNLYAFHGVLTIVTQYVKQQSLTGHAKLTARTPPLRVSISLFMLLAFVFPVARMMYKYIGPDEAAQRYQAFIFVQSGRVLTSKDVTELLHQFSGRYFGAAMGSRNFRQFMKALQIRLIQTDAVDMESGDEDPELDILDSLFAHSRSVGQSNYAISQNQSLRGLHQSTITQQQQVSCRYHLAVGLETFIDPLPSVQPSVVHPQASSPIDLVPIQRTLQHGVNQVMTGMQTGLGMIKRQFAGNSTLNGALDPNDLYVYPNLSSSIAFLGKGAVFRSTEQAQLVQSSFSEHHVLAVLPTGLGKALAFYSLAFSRPTRLTIVLVPFVALARDLVRRAAEKGIKACLFEHVQTMDPSLVIVTVDRAILNDFVTYVQANVDRIDRVCIDEAHEILTAIHYREVFHLILPKFATLGIAFTLLTATLAPRSQRPLLDLVGITDQSGLILLRGDPNRSNLAYSFEHVRDIGTAVTKYYKRLQLKPHERAIFFFKYFRVAKELAEELGVGCYHGSKEHDEAEKERLIAVHQKWLEGVEEEDRVVFSTSAFGAGIDFDAVRYVVIAECWGLVDFIQQSGRAGRDGKTSYIQVFYQDTKPQRTPPKKPMDSKTRELWEQDHGLFDSFTELCHQITCRRLGFQPLDPRYVSCGAIPNSAMCDLCTVIFKGNFEWKSNIFDPSAPLQIGAEGLYPTTVAFRSEELKATLNKGKISLYDIAYECLKVASSAVCFACWYLDRNHETEHLDGYSTRLANHVVVIRRSVQFQHAFISDAWCWACLEPFAQPFAHPRVSNGKPCPRPTPTPLMMLLAAIGYDERKFSCGNYTIDLVGQGSFSDTKGMGEWISQTAIPVARHIDLLGRYYQLRMDGAFKSLYPSPPTPSAVFEVLSLINFSICHWCHFDLRRKEDEHVHFGPAYEGVERGHVPRIHRKLPPYPFPTCRECWFPHQYTDDCYPIRLVSFVSHAVWSTRGDKKIRITKPRGLVGDDKEALVDEWLGKLDERGVPEVYTFMASEIPKA